MLEASLSEGQSLEISRKCAFFWISVFSGYKDAGSIFVRRTIIRDIPEMRFFLDKRIFGI
jgi:hypothetical protein